MFDDELMILVHCTALVISQMCAKFQLSTMNQSGDIVFANMPFIGLAEMGVAL